jgi:hypothetical protein
VLVATATFSAKARPQGLQDDLICADYQPSAREAEVVDAAFGASSNVGSNLETTQSDSGTPEPT